MTIKTIRVKNFKSFKDVEVHLGDFNVLIGANASGKSNFIHIIEFLRDIQRHGLENAISLQGGPEYLTNLNIGTREHVTVDVVVSEDAFGKMVAKSRTSDAYLFFDPREVLYSLSVSFPKKRVAFDIADERLSATGNFVVHGNESGHQSLGLGQIIVARQGQGTRPNVDIFLPEGCSRDDYDFDPWLKQSELGSSLVLESVPFLERQVMTDVAIYDFDPKLPKSATPITGKAELEEDGSNLAIVLKRIVGSDSDRRRLLNLLQDLLPFVTRLGVKNFADKSLLFSLKESFARSKYLPASLLSDGTINITAMIVALYFEKKAVAVIEEPERNVHPHLISRIIAMMKDASRQKQIVVTTHNPEAIKNADTGDVLLVSRDAEGFSTISRPAEQEEVKVFLQNQMGLEELFAQNLLHA